MSTTKEFKINVDNNFEQTAKDADKVSESVQGIGKSTPKVTKGFKGMSAGAKAFGMALKATGIGLVVALLASLKAAFERNQKVMDKVAVVTETIASVMNQVVVAITDAVSATSEAEGGFDNLKKTVLGLLTLAITPLKLAFYEIKLAIQLANLAYQKVFGNSESVKEANVAIAETTQQLRETAEAAVDAGRDIVENLGGAIDEIVSVTSTAVESISNINVEATNSRAEALVQARKNAQIAEAQNKVLLEQFDRQAEKLRQVRDEERNSIADRIEANNKLGETLEKQEKAMIKQADLAIKGARLELAQNNTTENRVALINALAEKEGVLATVEGLRSEQKVNDMALDKELIELTTTQGEAEATLLLERKKRLNDLQDDELTKLQGKKDILKEEKKIELDRLAKIVETATEGTQARLDAEIEYLTAKQDFELQEIELNNETQNAIQSKEKETLDYKKQLRDLDNFLMAEGVNKEIALLEQSYEEKFKLAKGDAERTKALEEKLASEKIVIEKKLQASKTQLAADGFGALSNLVMSFEAKDEASAKRQFKINKALQIGQTVASTASGIMQQLAVPQDALTGANFIKAGIVAATGAASLVKIANSKFQGGSAGGSAPEIASGGSQAPNFNVVGNSGINQIAQLQTEPTRAYVVSGEVTSQQSLDRNRQMNATL